MNIYKNLKIYALAFAVSLFAYNCGNDDDVDFVDDVDDGMVMEPDFSGTFVQQDQMGRPGINTVLSATDPIKDNFNTTIPSNMQAAFADDFLARAAGLHDAFGVEYEENILGLDAATLTGFLAQDVLQVAPDGPTTYFNPEGPIVLTGRNLTDDVIDVSLILLFGGMDGMRFNGQDTDGDGEADLPILVTDNVSSAGETPQSSFPYLEAPHTN